MSTNKYVQRGDSIPTDAQFYNSAIDAIRAYEMGRYGTHRPAVRDRDVVLVRNDSAAASSRFAVFGLNGPLIDPVNNVDAFQNYIAFSGVAPDEVAHATKFAIAQAPAAVGTIVQAVVDGVTIVRVRMEDESHEFATVKDNDTDRLLSASTGLVQLLWVQPEGQREDPDIAWCVARLGGVGGGGESSTPVILREVDESGILLKVQKVRKVDTGGQEWQWSDGFETHGGLINARPVPYVDIGFYKSLVVVGALESHVTILQMVTWWDLNIVLQAFKFAPISLTAGPYPQSEGAPHV